MRTELTRFTCDGCKLVIDIEKKKTGVMGQFEETTPPMTWYLLRFLQPGNPTSRAQESYLFCRDCASKIMQHLSARKFLES